MCYRSLTPSPAPFWPLSYFPGARNPGGNPQTTLDTLFDMASLTKVLATTTAVAQFYQVCLCLCPSLPRALRSPWTPLFSRLQRGEVGLDTRLADESLLGAEFSANGKEEITVRNMLLHNAGLPPDPVPGSVYLSVSLWARTCVLG